MQDIAITQNTDKAIEVIKSAGQWLLDTGKHPSKWWHPDNIHPDFLFQYAQPDEFYVAMLDDKPVAAAVLQFTQEAQDWKEVDGENPQPALFVHWLAVVPKFQGKGLSKVMVDFAAGLAKERGISLLRVDTNANELKLREVYEKLGFDLVKVIDEDYRQTAFYQKSIQ